MTTNKTYNAIDFDAIHALNDDLMPQLTTYSSTDGNLFTPPIGYLYSQKLPFNKKEIKFDKYYIHKQLGFLLKGCEMSAGVVLLFNENKGTVFFDDINRLTSITYSKYKLELAYA